MKIIPNNVTLRKGGLGYIVKGQKGKWYGSLPPSRESGDITGFSAGSRRRLRAVLATAQPPSDDWKPYGVCFTIPGRILNPDEVRRLWHNWVLLFRHYFNLPMIWRIELQARKQAHWHCVIWSNDDVPPVPLSEPFGKNRGFDVGANGGAPRPPRPPSPGAISGRGSPRSHGSIVAIFEVATLWRKLVRRQFGPFDTKTDFGFDEHGVNIQFLDGASSTGIVGYLADHTSKHKAAQLGWQGRQWGIVNRDILHFDTKVVRQVTERQHIKAARQYRRLQERLRARGGSYTGISITPSGNVNRSVFGRDAERLIKCYDIVAANS